MNEILHLLNEVQYELQGTLEIVREHRFYGSGAIALGVMFALQVLLTLWVVRRLRDVAHVSERVSRLADGLALLTDTTDAGLTALLRQVEASTRLPAAARPASPRTTTRRVAAAARNGQTAARIAQEEALSESEVRLHLAMAAAEPNGLAPEARPA